MTQLSYNYTNGQVGTPDPRANIVSVENPIALGTGNVDVNAGTTDGDYTIGLYLGTDKLAEATFTASSNSAAEIAEGILAAILAEPTFSGYVKSGEIQSTVNAFLTFSDPTITLELAVIADPSTVVTITNVAPAKTTVALGQILQSNGSGGWTQTYTDAAIALGAVCRSPEYLLPFDGADPGGPISPCMISLVQAGVLNVAVTTGVTVYRGAKVAYSPTTKTWQTTVAGTYILVEGAQWQTTGTGVQKVLLRFPSEN